MKLNLGCGRRPLNGYVNVDRNPHPGVVLADAEVGLPFADASVDEVYASHFLEHPVHFERVMHEIARVLKVGGLLHARVPYGFNANPYHRRYFDKRAVRTMVEPGGCTDEEPGRWRLVSMHVLRSGFPAWHIRRYLGVSLPGARGELDFTLVKVRE